VKPARFFRNLRAYIDETGMLEQGRRVLVGVSGGPDSMALLHGLVAVNRANQRDWHLHVGHLNHGLRGAEADADATFVSDQARALSLPVTVERIDVRAAAQPRQSLEEAARQHRYRFYERLALTTDSSCVAVGHHADDNAETILHRIIRGTGMRGLAGIAPNRPLRQGSDIRLIRPLLTFRRDEIEQFLADAGIEHRQDSTNLLPDHTRNRLRNELMPLIRRQFNVGLTDALLRLGQQAVWIDAYLRETAERALQTLTVSQHQRRLVLNVPGLLRKSTIVQTELIRQAMLRFNIGEQDVGFAHLVAVVELCRQSAGSKIVHLPGGLTATCRYDRLIFSVDADAPAPPISPVSLSVPGQTHVSAVDLIVEAELVDFRFDELDRMLAGKSRNVEWLDYDRLKPPLVLRSRQRGDRFRPLGAPGSKRLAEFLIDAKVEPADRNRVPIICDGDGPVWVVPHRIDDRARLGPDSRHALRLTVRSDR